ncbi:MAG: hypothetical protein ACNA8W_02650 [Bradymonadaceae bacterium]
MKGCLGVLALLSTAFSALMFLVFMGQVFFGAENIVLMLAMAALFAVIGTGSGFLTLRIFKESFGGKGFNTDQEEHRILTLASHKGGKLTAEEVSIHCHLTIDQSKRLLDSMVMKNTADTWISDGGSMVYVFRGLLTTDEKESAEDPFASLDLPS